MKKKLNGKMKVKEDNTFLLKLKEAVQIKENHSLRQMILQQKMSEVDNMLDRILTDLAKDAGIPEEKHNEYHFDFPSRTFIKKDEEKKEDK